MEPYPDYESPGEGRMDPDRVEADLESLLTRSGGSLRS